MAAKRVVSSHRLTGFLGSIPGWCWVQSYQRRLKMGVVSSCMVLTMKEGPRNITGRPGVSIM